MQTPNFKFKQMKNIIILFSFFFFTSKVLCQNIEVKISNIEEPENISIIGDYNTYLKKMKLTKKNEKYYIDTSGLKSIDFSHIGFENIQFKLNDLPSVISLRFLKKVSQLPEVIVRAQKQTIIKKISSKRTERIINKLYNFKQFYSLDFNAKTTTNIKNIEFDIKIQSVNKNDTLFITFFQNENDIFNNKKLIDTTYIFTNLTKKSKFVLTNITNGNFEPATRIYVAIWQSNNTLSEIMPVSILRDNISQNYLQKLDKTIIFKENMEYYKQNFGKYPNLNFKATINEN
jgi:hypothetical protein